MKYFKDFLCHIDVVLVDSWVSWILQQASNLLVVVVVYSLHKNLFYQSVPVHIGHSINTVDGLAKLELYIHNDSLFYFAWIYWQNLRDYQLGFYK